MGTVELQPKLISSATPSVSDEVTASLTEIYGFFFFSLALGYCFIFYTGGLFFYDLRLVNLNYFHKSLRDCISHGANRTRLDL